MVCAALASGKHVLCEKPFGRNMDDARRMCEAAEDSDLVNVIDFEFRMEPGIAKLKHLVDEGMIGPTNRIDVTWFTGGRSDPSLLWSWQHNVDAGGGVLEAFGSHVIDYVEWICQTSVVSVTARSHILIDHRKGIDGVEREVTAEDSCDIICDLANGAVASLKFSNSYPYPSGHRIEMYGEHGRLVYEHEAPFLSGSAKLWMETHSRKMEQVKLAKYQLEKGLDSRALTFRELAKRFSGAAIGLDVRGLPNFTCGLRVRRVLQAVRVSLATCKKVSVFDGAE
jgi:predicted dehydrogenase